MMSDRDEAGKRVAGDGGLGTSGSTGGSAVGDTGVGEEAEGEAKADRRGDCGVAGGDRG